MQTHQYTYARRDEMSKRTLPAPASTQEQDAIRQQIAREKREVRILESERSLLRSRFAARRRPHPAKVGATAADATPANKAKKRPRPRRGGNGDAEGGGGNDRDLLDVLDALQCRTTLEARTQPPPSSSASGAAMPDDGAASSGLLGEVDPDSYRLHPVLGGVVFTKVEGPLPPATQDRQQQDDHVQVVTGSDLLQSNKRRMYILSGHTLDNPVGGCVGFEVRAEVSFANRSGGGGSKGGQQSYADEERATVSSVETRFFPHASIMAHEDTSGGTTTGSRDAPFSLPFPEEELQELSEVVAKTRSLTQLFRELGAFGDFHRDRCASMERLVTEFGGTDGGGSLSVVGADMMEIRGSRNKKVGKDDPAFGNSSGAGGLRLRLSWSRSFSELGREDDLCVEDCTVGHGDDRAGNGSSALVDAILDPDGIDSLVHCAGGFEEAVRAILRAISGTP